jgi:hypothetical protein
MRDIINVLSTEMMVIILVLNIETMVIILVLSIGTMVISNVVHGGPVLGFVGLGFGLHLWSALLGFGFRL